MNPENSDIRTVDRAAHIETAGQRHPAVGRQFHVGEVLEQVIHHRLDDA